MEECVFCKIIQGKIPSFKIWENEKHLAFLDINPINPGHTLLIPKKHNEYLWDLNNKEYTELTIAAKQLAKSIQQKIKCEKVGMAVEGFGVPHVHIHIVPLNNPNELNPERAKPMEKEKLKDIQKRLK